MFDSVMKYLPIEESLEALQGVYKDQWKKVKKESLQLLQLLSQNFSRQNLRK